MRTILQTDKHTIQVGDTSPSAELWAKGLRENEWQKSELLRTDSMLRPDRPDHQAILNYSAALRAYNNHPDFPNGTRPTCN